MFGIFRRRSSHDENSDRVNSQRRDTEDDESRKAKDEMRRQIDEERVRILELERAVQTHGRHTDD